MTDRTILIKVSEDGKQRYRLVKFNNKYVIFRDSGAQGKEAGFGDEIKGFSDEAEAKKFLDKLK